MPSVTKITRGYRAFVRIKNHSSIKTFRTKREADAWAHSEECKIRISIKKDIDRAYTLGDALERYKKEITPSKKGMGMV